MTYMDFKGHWNRVFGKFEPAFIPLVQKLAPLLMNDACRNHRVLRQNCNQDIYKKMKKSFDVQKSFLAVLRHQYIPQAIVMYLFCAFVVLSAFSGCHLLNNTAFLEICSGLGTKVIAVQGDTPFENDVPIADHQKSHTFCPSCAAHKLATSDVTLPHISVSLHSQNKSIAINDHHIMSEGLFTAHPPRAPPALIS